MPMNKTRPWRWFALAVANVVGIAVPIELYSHTDGAMQAIAALCLVVAACFLLITDIIAAAITLFDAD